MQTINIGKATHKLVLLIDDSPIDNFVNEKMIERNKFSKNVIVFTKAIKALDYLKEVDKNKTYETDMPSIIFLDLNMPIMDGHAFIKLFKNLSDEIKNGCKIIILTSSVNPKDLDIINKNKLVLTIIGKPLIKKNFDLIDLLINDKPSEKLGVMACATR